MRICKVCGEQTGFPEPIKGRNICRPCYNKKHQEWRARTPEKRKQYYQKNREAIISKVSKWAKENKEKRRVIGRTWRWRIRMEMIEAYGGACTCCGEIQPEFLSIDHIRNDGYTKRLKGEPSGAALYKVLRDKGWPRDEYQLLCMNCNFAKGHFGECPHKKPRDFNTPMWGRKIGS